MRIIAGEFRGRVIKSPPGKKTRPTSDRLRETLFNILAPQIDSETRFLDLCAGTGAVGIEAISRGAGLSAFVDKSRRSCGLIEENLDLLQIPKNRSEVICDNAKHFLSRLNEKTWDIIFYDPPYNNDYDEVLAEIGKSTSESFKSIRFLVVEHHFKKELALEYGAILRFRVVRQGDAFLSFYRNA